MVETRRNSSSSKRPFSSSCPLPNGKRSKVSSFSQSCFNSWSFRTAEASSSTNDTTCAQPIETLSSPKESGSEFQDHEARSSDPECVKLSDGHITEKSPDAKVECEPFLPPMSLGHSVIDVEKANSNCTLLNRGKKRQLKSSVGVAWGKLLSQSSQSPHVVMHGSAFTVGQGRQCDLWVADPSISKVLCSLKHIDAEQVGPSVTLLEIIGGKGAVQVNGKVYPKNSTVPLNGGDEVVFSSCGKHAYIFQPLANDNLAASGMLPSVTILEAHGGPVEGLHLEARTGDPSAVAVASTLASLSNLQNKLPLIPPSSQNDEGVQQDSEMPAPPSCEMWDSGVVDADHNDRSGASLSEKAVVPSLDAANENLNFDSVGLDTSVDAEIGKVSGATHEVKPLLRMLAGSSASDFDLNDSISKIFDEPSEGGELLKDFDPPVLTSAKHQTFKDELKQGIIDAKNIEVSFENFPYYLSDTTKNVLIASTYIHLKRSKFAKYTLDLPTVYPRILLSGPTGSEIYQETLTKALAKHFDAGLLVIDSLLLPGGSTPTEFSPAKESSRPERASIFVKRSAQTAVLHLKKRASSVEADIIGGSTISNRAQHKQEASTASSRKYTFKKGDRVKYVGSLQCGLSPLQTPLRGPAYGYRGKVLLAFEENGFAKLGVRFDRSILEGNNLGGLCEDDHGFFCAADLLLLDSSNGDDIDKHPINELFEVASKGSKRSPLILFVKGIEKSMANPETYALFKNELENLPQNVVVIASHTQLDNPKEKSHPGALLFTKFGGNQTTLLDFAFPDSLTRLQDKSKETPKTMKQLTRLFPNKVDIQLPQDETLLSDWKQLLDQDIGTLKSQSNIVTIHSVLDRIGVDCPDLEMLCIKDQALTSESVEKMIGWALGHHFMHCSEALVKKTKLVISRESIRFGLDTLQGMQNETKSLKMSLKVRLSLGWGDIYSSLFSVMSLLYYRLFDYAHLRFQDVVTENEFEKKLLSDVIPSSDIGVIFDDIGALENVKDTLKELVMLPLQRPELFCKGQLTKVKWIKVFNAFFFPSKVDCSRHVDHEFELVILDCCDVK
ncbi:unnamed protein product [Ilex paraguariensis]|uniref:DUF7751 domain-containing protein n=1 Tax=Ilex paraguariensis TaxID=185542 RepID=A0ABC8UEF6_9AQUA